MKNGTAKIAGGAVTDAADYVGVANAIERDRFVLEVLNKSSFEVVVEIVLEKNIQCLYDDISVGRLRRRERVAREKDLGIAALTEPLAYVVAFVEPAILQRKLFHRSEDVIVLRFQYDNIG